MFTDCISQQFPNELSQPVVLKQNGQPHAMNDVSNAVPKTMIYHWKILNKC